MICDNCAWKESCLMVQAVGQHRSMAKCEEYFPDLTHAKPRQPGKFATLEKRMHVRKGK